MKHSIVGVWACCVAGLLNTTAPGAEFLLVPIGASGTHTISGNEITLEGGGQQVFLEVRMAGWGPSLLKAWQADIVSSGYSSGLKGVLTPATVSCATTADCEAALGRGSVCGDLGGPAERCSAGFIDPTRTDYVFASVSDISVVDISTLDYRYAATLLQIVDVPDPGVDQYGGSLVLDVPVDASGTFTIGFQGDVCDDGEDEGKPCDYDDVNACPGGSCSNASSMLGLDFQFIRPLTLTPARITVTCPKDPDCDLDGVADCLDLCRCSSTAAVCVCPPTGLCCFPSGRCVDDFPRDECIAQGGEPDCVESPCRFGCLPEETNGDFDRDGDQDLTDVGHFLVCFSGSPEEPNFVEPSAECLVRFDLDGDNDIDLTDLGEFGMILSGPS